MIPVTKDAPPGETHPKWGPSWAWAGALAVPLYYALSMGALDRFLDHAAAEDGAQWQQGIRWDFDDSGDLAGPIPAAIARGGIEDSTLRAPEAELSDFVSLNLRGQEIDARRIPRLRLRIWREHAGAALLFFRESLDGPDYRSPPLPLEAGWQELSLALNHLTWRAHLDGPGADSQPWGGASGTVSSLRLHPVVSGRSGYTLDWIALEPSAPAAPRQVAGTALRDAISTLEQQTTSRILALSDRWPRPAPVMALRERIEQDWPASSVVLGPPGAPSPVSRPLAPIIMLALSLGLTVPALVWRRRRAVAATLWLGVIALAAAGLLVSQPPPRELPTLALLAWFALLVLAHALAESRTVETALGGAAAWRQAALATVIALLPPALLAPGQELAPPSLIAARWLWYLPWAAFQQLLLCAVLYRLLRRLPIPSAVAAAGASLLFGLGHFPNFELMLGTFALAAGCLALYRRQPAIAPLAVLHATVGTAYLSLLPPSWLFSGAVGMRFFLG